MTFSIRKSIAFAMVMALALCLLPCAHGWAEDIPLPPEGDSVESPFDPSGYISPEEFDLDGMNALGMSADKYKRVMDFALQYQGWKYVWGGRFPSQGGFDCAGLVLHTYNNVFGCGFDVVNTNAERLYNNHCKYVAANVAQPGDLVFWRGTYGSDINRISHVGIYCGNGTVYAAGDPIGYYKIESTKNIRGETAAYFFASIRGLDDGVYDIPIPADAPANSVPMFRLYNSNSSEHFYTSSVAERSNLIQVGWQYEGIGWYAPKEGADVYRLYNSNAGDHHYTTSAAERDMLVSVGWSYEGVGWKSGGKTAVLRQYNPYVSAGAHNFTTSSTEHDFLVSIGWSGEGTAWYAIQ